MAYLLYGMTSLFMALAGIMIIDYVTQLKKEEIAQAITQVDSASFSLYPHITVYKLIKTFLSLLISCSMYLLPVLVLMRNFNYYLLLLI